MKAISGLPNTTMSIKILISNGKLALNISYKKTSKDSADSEGADSGNADSENASETSDKEVSYRIRRYQISLLEIATQLDSSHSFSGKLEVQHITKDVQW